MNAVAPGLIRSEVTSCMLERVGDPTAAFPRRRIGEPDHLDSTLLYSHFVTGTIVRADDVQSGR